MPRCSARFLFSSCLGGPTIALAGAGAGHARGDLFRGGGARFSRRRRRGARIRSAGALSMYVSALVGCRFVHASVGSSDADVGHEGGTGSCCSWCSIGYPSPVSQVQIFLPIYFFHPCFIFQLVCSSGRERAARRCDTSTRAQGRVVWSCRAHGGGWAEEPRAFVITGWVDAMAAARERGQLTYESGTAGWARSLGTTALSFTRCGRCGFSKERERELGGATPSCGVLFHGPSGADCHLMNHGRAFCHAAV